jgi:hypothetical protein
VLHKLEFRLDLLFDLSSDVVEEFLPYRGMWDLYRGIDANSA